MRRDARTRTDRPDEQALTAAILATALDCIITMDSRGLVVEFNPAAERTFGYRRAEVIGRPLAELIIPERLRERHRQGLARYLATGEGPVLGRRIELSALRSDGSEFPVELAITRLDAGREPLFTAYLRDISERARGEQLRNLRLAVTQQLAKAGDAASAGREVVRVVCEHLGWDYGAFWWVERAAGKLRCHATWASSQTEAFDRASRAREFRRGEGLPGRVWERAQATWLEDVQADANFPRAAAAAAAGLRSAFACPISVGGEAIGVLEFFTRRLQEPDAELLETMATLAAQTGQFVERRLAEDRLRESEARFRALMDQAPFSMQIFSPDGGTLRVNPAWSALWGVTLEQISDYNVLADAQLEAKGVAPYLRRAFAGEPVAIPPIRYDPNETLPERTRHADPARYVAAVAYPLKDEVGHVREVVLVHEDITARRRAEEALRESEEKLRLLADTIPQLAWMARPDGHIFWYNRRWYEYTGTTVEEMEGWGWQSVHDPAVLPQVLERWRSSIAHAEPFDMVFPLRGADGAFRPFLTRVNPLRDAKGGVLYWFGTNTDISELKRMEEALREADRRKDEFLAMLAHELRNPLAPIVNCLQLLKVGSLEPAMAQRTRDVMERQVQQLVRLVDDLLDVSRVVRGKIELAPEPLELAAVIARAVETAQPFLDARRHRLEISLAAEPLFVRGDAVRLAQVVANLLNNAAKYTEPDGRIVVRTAARGDEALLSVEDNGAGIAPELLARVFEPFVQGEQAGSGSQGGLGIGLTLAKTLVELHGGRVEAHSDGFGKGARFTIRLPRLAERGGAEAAPRAAHLMRADAARRVLVVDDNRDAADTLAALLRVSGHDVRVAYDGGAALAVGKAEPPDVVFLDIGMPGMDGYETARRLRAMPQTARAMLVALTGWGQEEDQRRSAAAGFDRHLVKPAEPAALQAILSRALREPR